MLKMQQIDFWWWIYCSFPCIPSTVRTGPIKPDWFGKELWSQTLCKIKIYLFVKVCNLSSEGQTVLGSAGRGCFWWTCWLVRGQPFITFSWSTELVGNCFFPLRCCGVLVWHPIDAGCHFRERGGPQPRAWRSVSVKVLCFSLAHGDSCPWAILVTYVCLSVRKQRRSQLVVLTWLWMKVKGWGSPWAGLCKPKFQHFNLGWR